MKSKLQPQISACEAQIPDSESFSSLFTSGAQDSVFGVCSLLDFCINPDITRIVLAARYPTDSIDLYVQEIEQMSTSGAELEARILQHPLMQQELKRQKRDLDLLLQMGRGAIGSLLHRQGTEDALQLETGT